MNAFLFGRRIAATAIGAALLAASATGTASAGDDDLVTFDEISFDGVLGTIAPDHYASHGLIFSNTPHIVDLSIGHPGEIDAFIVGGGSPNNALVLSTSIDQLFIDFHFIDPDTFAPAVTDWVSVTVFDTNVGTLFGSIEAFDIDGTSVGFVDAVTDLSFVTTLSLAFEGIHRIRLSTDLDGNMFDNIAFGPLQAAGPGDVPAPGALALLTLGTLAGRRRRAA